MASELHVDAIKHSGGTSALTIDSSGNLTTNANLHSVGHIIQTVESQGIFNQVTTTGSSFVNSNMQLAITPKFASSFILCNFRCWCSCDQSSGGIRLQVTRNGVNVEGGYLGVGEKANTSGPSYWEEFQHICLLDKTHNSTSALTYIVTLMSNGGTARVGVSNRTGTMILQEIAQ